jgi:hypothetical protein
VISAALDQEQGDAPVEHGRHDEGIGLITRGHHALVPAQSPTATIATTATIRPGRGGATREVVARGALLMRQHHQRRTVGHARQPRRCQRGVPALQQGRCDQGTLRIGGRHQAAPQFLQHHHGLHRTEAHAALRFGHGQCGQAQFGEFAIYRAGRATGLGQRMPTLEPVLLADPARHRLAQ